MMLTNLARYNAPGIKDNKKVTGKRNQRDRHQMADECEKKRDRIAKSDMQHREKQQRMMENIRAEIFADQQESTLYNAIAVPPGAGLQKRAHFSQLIVGLAETGDQTRATCVAASRNNRSAIHFDFVSLLFL
jgi:hypothetical protein